MCGNNNGHTSLCYLSQIFPYFEPKKGIHSHSGLVLYLVQFESTGTDTKISTSGLCSRATVMFKKMDGYCRYLPRRLCAVAHRSACLSFYFHLVIPEMP